jgi:RNA polymerase sigma-70 factor (ECF subfamily)
MDELTPELTRLALAAGDGDRVALAAFVRRTQPDVWRLCRHLAGPAHADDLTQDVYVRALRALPAFRGDASARTWLLTIARRTVADAIRREQRRRRLVPRSPAPFPDHAGRVALEALLAPLDADRREAFVLTQLLGLSYAEAADVAGVPVGTVRSRVARARAELAADVEVAEEA